MNIKMYEFKKIFSSPVIVILTLLFLSFNLLNIFNSRYISNDFDVLNKIVNKVGFKIDNNMKENLKAYYEEEFNKLNEKYFSKYNKTYENITEAFNDNELYSKKELKDMEEVAIIQSYYYEILALEEKYDHLTIDELAKYSIEANNLKGKSKEVVERVYENFEERFHKLKENGEQHNLFISPKYKMHNFLFIDILRSCALEIAILIVLIVAHLINFEFENKTYHITYSSKRGRKLLIDKLCSSLVASLIVITLILGVTLAMYFITFDYSSLLNVPISTYFNWEYQLPLMSWFNISFIQYLLLTIGVIYACELIFLLVTFSISCFVKNTYLVFAIFFIIFGIVFLLPEAIGVNNILVFLTVFTPFNLIMMPSNLFSLSGILNDFKYYEVYTLIIWTIALIVLTYILIKRFKKQNLT
ncbi:ABC transporter permease subunit [Clostridium tarantellae]|uniref:Uncharacterized protein n=1 Tax=Clostridium tarantellae TaxID=39493 RepID=A0A6I1MLN4_9CLOT|nr:ABC transporter permease subunit [Clostridium tarantellae]MPQ43914.1 hypothetical protein [Clostridium tarantellae]